MATVEAELHAVESLRAYLLRTLPAKVTSINSGRAAVLTAPRAGPYTIGAGMKLAPGAAVGTSTQVTLTAGSRTAAQVAAEINAAPVAGITASADSLGRLVLTANSAPTEGTPSVVFLGPDVLDGSNAAFGWGPGGHEVVTAAVVAPTYAGVCDGEPDDPVDLGSGFWVILGERSAEPDANIRKDRHRVRIAVEVLAAEPNNNVKQMPEYIGQCVRAIREVLHEDRTLDGTVYLVELPRTQDRARAFQFTNGFASGLFSSAQMTVVVHVFERS